jgi:murein DD-endopeptidase MepM/ murein hydrolase activator NlpD
MKINSVERTVKVAAFLAAYLIPAIACNFPRGEADRDPFFELRQTLTALAPTLESGGTALPLATDLPGTPVFSGLETATSPGLAIASPQPPSLDEARLFFTYLAQSGDTLAALAGRFTVDPEQITSSQPISPDALIQSGQALSIPNTIGDTPYPSALLPDSEVVYSPSTTDLHLSEFVSAAGGYLSTYGEEVEGQWVSGADLLQKVALENSINPRLLLAFLEFRSGWVFGQPADPTRVDYPIGFYVPGYRGLYNEMLLTATQLGIGYYGWRAGTLTSLKFPDGKVIRISPGLNPGSVALQALFSKFYRETDWVDALYGEQSFLKLYELVFPNPWGRAATVEPLFPPGVGQPPMELPFPPAERWSFTGGPHLSWNSGTPRGAVDFSPVTGQPPCAPSSAWVTASAAGVVTRSADNLVAIDLDGDGFEQTGWVLIYLHLTGYEGIPQGTRIELDTRLGHPSCERGKSTGTHVHMVRKFNGEWVPAASPLPYVLSGWQVEEGSRSYEGYLVNGDQIVSANPGGSQSSIIIR